MEMAHDGVDYNLANEQSTCLEKMRTPNLVSVTFSGGF